MTNETDLIKSPLFRILLSSRIIARSARAEVPLRLVVPSKNAKRDLVKCHRNFVVIS